MRISASISSLQKRQIPDTVSMLDQAGVNFYHLDSVENREIFDFAKSLGEITQTPMDLHLITSDPVKYWDEIRESGIDAIVIQLEALHSTLIIPEDMRGKVGLAILATSSPELFKPYEKVASSLLIMTTTPGYSGGKFQKGGSCCGRGRCHHEREIDAASHRSHRSRGTGDRRGHRRGSCVWL